MDGPAGRKVSRTPAERRTRTGAAAAAAREPMTTREPTTTRDRHQPRDDRRNTFSPRRERRRMVLPSPSVSPPLVTPFAADGDVDVDALYDLARNCLDAGLDGLVPCGTTGEFASLTDSEWRTVVETTVEAADGRAPVVAGVADTTVTGALDRLGWADTAGADAGLLPMPYYHPANDPAGTEGFLRAVADDSPLPIYLYDIPSCTGTKLAAATTLALADHDRIVGCKDSSGEFSAFLDLGRRRPDGFSLLQGFDDQLVPSMAFGADGGINALSQAIPEAYVAARDAVAARDHDEARCLHEEAIEPLFGLCYDHGFAPVTKSAVADRGWIPGDAVRPPLVALDEDAREEVAAAVQEALDAI